MTRLRKTTLMATMFAAAAWALTASNTASAGENQLARLEGQVAIQKLLQQFPRMRQAQKRVEWVPNAVLRGLKTLPVAL